MEKIDVVLKKSLIGSTKRQVTVANSLGLRKVGDRVVQPDNGATRGKISKISHLLQVT